MTHPTDAAIAQAYRDVVIDWDGTTTAPVWPGLKAIRDRARELDAAKACTCPSGDGSLRWPCPQHPPEKCLSPDCVKAGVACVKNATCATPATQAVVVRALENAAVDHGVDIVPTSLIYMARAAIAAMQTGEGRNG